MPQVSSISIKLHRLIWITGFAILLTAQIAGAQQQSLTFRAISAEYSKALDRIVMISSSPDVLHIYTPNGPSDTTVALSMPPLSLSVSPDGLFAAVGHDRLISYVSLSDGSVQRT